jgi:hypothetical protein
MYGVRSTVIVRSSIRTISAVRPVSGLSEVYLVYTCIHVGYRSVGDRTVGPTLLRAFGLWFDDAPSSISAIHSQSG